MSSTGLVWFVPLFVFFVADLEMNMYFQPPHQSRQPQFLQRPAYYTTVHPRPGHQAMAMQPQFRPRPAYTNSYPRPGHQAMQPQIRQQPASGSVYPRPGHPTMQPQFWQQPAHSSVSFCPPHQSMQPQPWQRPKKGVTLVGVVFLSTLSQQLANQTNNGMLSGKEIKS